MTVVRNATLKYQSSPSFSAEYQVRKPKIDTAENFE